MSEGPPQPPPSLRSPPFAEPPPSPPLLRRLRAEAPGSESPAPAPAPTSESYPAPGKRPRRDKNSGGFRRKSQTARFNRCVKGVRKTIKPRPKSTKEAAAIAICTKTLLHSKGRTLKKYRKGRLMTQKLRRKRSD